MGLKDELLADDNIWMCATCYECQERCPREIKIVDIVKIVRNYASKLDTWQITIKPLDLLL